MHINQNFDSGNIEVVSTNERHADLTIRTDSNSEFKQWFHFQVNGAVGKKYSFSIVNAADCSYEAGWEDYHVVASYDGEDWFRVASRYDNKKLSFDHQFEYSSVFFAYFAPYSYQRHQQLIANAQLAENCLHQVLGLTVEGRNMDLLVIGEQTKKPIWITARQHPGETMAQWCAEGLIEALLDPDSSISRSLLQDFCFFVVPNMNPDGAIKGNLRSNAAGANLNREWLKPSKETSPEVYWVREKMQQTGVEGYLDLHGDEGLPYVFVAAVEGNPSYSDKQQQLESAFSKHLMAINPDFQTKFGYDKDEAGKADLRIANNWVGENFGCLALTLEMPFKDNANLPNAITGWSPERSYHLGQSLLTALSMTLK
ncbi:M14-type cytosolic carboxypeptidase [Kangiella sp. TOML190]|uniref:M14 family metallopeptidase n=1 Tax=Kangiella sp. TOML190 TaxID=2931351 RepID=UPI00203AD529|nr:M14-type cytosolic carboxypeptidase [Kangiella sp. TOML190]